MKKSVGTFIILCVLFASPLRAQIRGNDSTSLSRNSSSVIIKKMQEEKERKKEEQAIATPSIEIEESKIPEELEPEVKFVVQTVKLEGNTALPDTRFKAILASYEGKEWSLRHLKKLARQITQIYTEEGYLTSFAYIPYQQIKEGILTIQIIEGRIGKIYIQGNRYFRKNKILSYSNIKEGDIVRLQNIRESLYRMNENPDRTVTAGFRRGGETGTSDLYFTVKDQLPVHGAFQMDKEGTKTSGRNRFGFVLTSNNTTTMDDVLSVGTLFGRDFGVFFTEYQMPLSKYRTKLVGSFSHAQVTPKRHLKPFGVNSKSQNYFAGLEHNLYQNDTFQFDLRHGVEFTESRTKLLSGTFTRERLRVYEISPRMTWSDKTGFNQIRQEFLFGMDAFGATIFADPEASRQGVKPHYFIYKGNLLRLQNLPYDMRISAKFSYQHSSRKLPSQQAFYLGGAGTVRGYPEGDYLGDSGVLANYELIVPTYIFPKNVVLPFSDRPLRNQLELIGFFDHGYGRLRGPSEIEEAYRHLVGIGGGLRFRLNDHLYARTEWGQALGDHPLSHDSRQQFHFRLQAET